MCLESRVCTLVCNKCRCFELLPPFIVALAAGIGGEATITSIQYWKFTVSYFS